VRLAHGESDGSDNAATYTFSKASHAAQTWKVPLGVSSPKTYSADIRFIAYDRTKSSELHQKDLVDPVLLLDRQAH